jgi:hypothetical protein
MTETKQNAPTETPAPTTPAVDLTKVTSLKDLLDARPSYDGLLKLGLGKLADFAKAAVNLDVKIKEQTKDFRGNSKWLGKVLAAMKREYAKAQDAGILSQGESFAQYHEKVAGGLPNNHAESCANTFNSLVVTGRLPETDYDAAPTDWLETASTIIKLATKAGKTLDCEEAAKVVTILKKREVDTAAKQLRSIRNGLKGEPTKPDGSPTLTPETFIAVLRQGLNQAFHSLLIAEVVAEIMHISNRAPETIKGFYLGGIDVTDAWEKSGVSPDDMSRWETDRRPVTEKPAPNVLPLPAPDLTVACTEWAKANYPDMTAEEQNVIVSELAKFHAQNGRVPNSVAEFDSVMEAVTA